MATHNFTYPDIPYMESREMYEYFLLLDKTTRSLGDAINSISKFDYGSAGAVIPVYRGATDSKDGVAGLVPPAKSEEKDYVLTGSGEWVWPSNLDLSGIDLAALGVPPKPMGGTGVSLGTWKLFSSETEGSSTANLPNGGAWAFFAFARTYPDNIVYQLWAGVHGGGAPLNSSAPSSTIAGFCWRVR